MKIKQCKIICIIVLLIYILAIIHTNSYAATMNMSISKTSGYVGDTFTVTISGINGKVTISSNSNVTLNKSGSQWVDGSLTITGTAKTVGTGKITVTPVDVTTTAAEPEEVTTSASRTISIKEKEVTQTPATPPATTTTTKKPTTTTKPATTTKTETKAEEKKEDNFYISSVTLKGIKENEEQVDIALSPQFNKDTYEYTCNVTSDIKKIELQKDAGEFTNSVIVTGLEELKEGENIITLQLSAENYKAKTYTIKVIKEKQEIEETVDTVAQIEENNKEKIKTETEEQKTKMISMPFWVFIVMQISIIIVEVLVIRFIPWKNLFKFKNKNIDINK